MTAGESGSSLEGGVSGDAGPPLLAVSEVSKAYRSGAETTVVLDQASFEIDKGQTVSLVGASGSGKSTLISLIAGLRKPDAGTILFEGRDVGGMAELDRARLRADRIGVVLQSGNLIPWLTASENVELAIDLAGGREAAGRARALLGEVGLADRVAHLPWQLSGGEAQRVSLATALANDPDLLLADEVTGELDSDTADQVVDIIFSAAAERGLAILFVTHSLELAARAQRQLQIVAGQVCLA